MTRLCIHIGLHKTGSTALQHALLDASDTLSAHGIHYIRSGRENEVAHHPLARQTCDSDDIAAVAPSRAWDAVIAEAKDSVAEQAVVSSEVFHRLTRGHVEGILHRIEQSGLVVEPWLLAYVRPQTNLIASQYSQQIRAGYRRDTFAQFANHALSANPRWLDFRGILEPWIERLGHDRVAVRVAEPECLAGDSVQADFFSLIRRPELVEVLKGPKRRNVSLSAATLDQIRDVLHRTSLWSWPFSDRRALLVAFAEEVLQPLYVRDPASPVFGRIEPDRALLQRCRSMFADQNHWIAERCLGGEDLIDRYYDERIRALDGGETASRSGTGSGDLPGTRVKTWLAEHARASGYGSLAAEIESLC